MNAVRLHPLRRGDALAPLPWQPLEAAPGQFVLPTIAALGGPLAPPLTGLRLEIDTPEPALLLRALRLMGTDGACLWTLDPMDPAVKAALCDHDSQGLHVPPLPGREGLLLLVASPQITIDLPVPAEILTHRSAGARLSLEIAPCPADVALLGAAREIAALHRQTRALTNRLHQGEEEGRYLHSRIAAIEASTSWRLTAPLRAIKTRQVLPALKRRLRAFLLRQPFGDLLLRLHARLARRRAATEPAQDLADAKARFRAEKLQALDQFLASGDRLVLPRAEAPLVTILLVLWNQAELSYACLAALATETTIPVEILIADNASTDRTADLLARIDGANILRNSDNLGFLRAVNQAAAAARGEHLLLLNNDAVMRPGALRAALETLTAAPDIGAVGGRIVLLNGRLQEAGSLIWRNGACLGYGRNLPPDAGEVMFRRDVDYCSGAFLLFRRDLFREMGGFDDRFAPAYYEETDFCVRLWQRGLRVVYEPQAVIDHFEFGSSEKSGAALALQQKNQRLFLEKHRAFLAGQAEADPANLLAARSRATTPRAERVLVLDDRVPLPPLGAGFPRACHLLHAMVASGRQVTTYPIHRPDESWEAIRTWLPPTVEVMLSEGKGGLEAFLNRRKGFYDTVIVSRPHNMLLLRALLRADPMLLGGARLIYDAEAVFAGREKHRAQVLGLTAEAAQADRAIDAEVALAAVAQRIATVSPMEAAYFTARGYRDVHVLGHGIAPKPTNRPFAARHDLLFVGLLAPEGSPNVDSLLWFGQAVMPHLRPLVPEGVALQAVGRRDADSLDALAGSGVRLVGPVADLTPIYDRARVFVAPTRFAGGIPHKIHEAAAFGLPTVTTPLLAAQLGWTAGEDILTADTPEDFARQVAALYQDADLWQRVRTNALARLTADCDPGRFQQAVEQLLAP